MKKVLYFLILLLIPCIVLADNEIFVETSKEYNDKNSIIIEQYKDGYILVNEFYDGNNYDMFLEQTNKQGEIIKSVSIGMMPYPLQAITSNEGIILFRYVNNQTCLLEKYDENLEKKKELTIENCRPVFNAYVETVLDSYAIIDNDYLYYYDQEGTVGKINLDLSSQEIINMSEEEIEELLPKAYYYKKIQDSLPSTYMIMGMDVNNDFIVVNIIDNNQNCTDDPDVFCAGQMLRVYDKDLNITKELILTKNHNIHIEKQVVNIRIVHDYLVASSMKLNSLQYSQIDPSQVVGQLEIYDSDWNLIQTIEKGRYIPLFIKSTDTGFMTSSLNYLNNYANESDSVAETAIYSINPPIDVPTIDHGRIIVPSNALAGETVTIEVKPDKGFTLSELTVLDANGNKIPVTNNTFVMGTSKVTVLATFTPENPNTGNFYVILICLIAAISGIVLVFQKRKLDFLK